MFTAIRVSTKTLELVEKFDQLYREHRVFKEGPQLKNDPELEALLPRLHASLAEDIRKHKNLSKGGKVSGSVLFNAGHLVSYQDGVDGCTVYYGWYDDDTQMCTYIGSTYVCNA